MGEEQLQNVILNGRQGHRRTVHHHLLGPVVHRDGAHGEHTGRLLRSPQCRIAAQLALHPGDHLQGIEGLCNVVVRPDVKSQDLVCILALGGKQDNGHIAPLPQLGRGPDAIQLRHHHVHQDQMDLVFLRRLDSLPAVICRDGAVPFAGQVDIQCGDDVPVIVTNQYRVQTLSPRSFISGRLSRSGPTVL